jgi:hypothetical protein
MDSFLHIIQDVRQAWSLKFHLAPKIDFYKMRGIYKCGIYKCFPTYSVTLITWTPDILL